MIVYTHDAGYANTDIDKVKAIIDSNKIGLNDKALLKELVFDYEVLLSVVDGKSCLFRHSDGSETRRIRLYG